MAHASAVRDEVLRNLEDLGSQRFRSTIFSLSAQPCVLAFPADCWEIAREAGFGEFRVLLEAIIHVDLYGAIGTAAEQVGLAGIEFSGIYRPAGGSSVHPQGRGLDIRAIAQSTIPGSLLWTQLSKTSNAEPESALTAAFHNALLGEPKVSQVLSPWRLCTKGQNPACQPNNLSTELGRIHRNHLHLTVSP